MKSLLATFAQKISVLRNDDRGDNENLGRMLILALVLVPLVVLVSFFGKQIFNKGACTFNKMINDPGTATSYSADACKKETYTERP